MSTVNIGTGSGGIGTANTAITVQGSGTTFGTVNYAPPIMVNANSPMYSQYINLSNSNNAITSPTVAGGVIFTPPTANTNTITLKGVNGDTGIAVSKIASCLFTFDTTPANFVITTGGAINACELFWY
jgi:hypothetical protein